MTQTLFSQGRQLDVSRESFGYLRGSSASVSDVQELRTRLDSDGYLFLRGYLNRDEVSEARIGLLSKIRDDGLLDPTQPFEVGALRSNAVNYSFRPDLAAGNSALHRVLYDGPMIALFERLFDESVRHYDYTWIRTVGRGKGTEPHCDIVYMGRGTRQLYTAWTPLGDIPLSMGGLIILEGSHRRTEITGEYLEQDVDSFCENGPNAEAIRTGKMGWEHWQKMTSWSGAISNDPVALRSVFGSRWLTCPDYRMGDVLIFTMSTVHASLDNSTDFVRLSSDTRYQRASEPVDERWVVGPNGEAPPAHGLNAKRSRIC